MGGVAWAEAIPANFCEIELQRSWDTASRLNIKTHAIWPTQPNVVMYDSRLLPQNDDTILFVRHDSGMTTFSYESGCCNMLNHLDNDTDCIIYVSCMISMLYHCWASGMNHV